MNVEIALKWKKTEEGAGQSLLKGSPEIILVVGERKELGCWGALISIYTSFALACCHGVCNHKSNPCHVNAYARIRAYGLRHRVINQKRYGAILWPTGAFRAMLPYSRIHPQIHPWVCLETIGKSNPAYHISGKTHSIELDVLANSL